MISQKKLYLRIFFSFFLTILLVPSSLEAASFNKNFIVSDFDQFDKNSLSKSAIQTFLQSKNSVLATTTDLFNGAVKKASQIIWEVAQEQTISPKFILYKLQNEQGLIERASATQKALDWALGYSCFGGTCNEKYKGIGKQIDAGATTFRIYTNEASRFSYKVGKTSTTSDGYSVTPQNQATANLYIYTPFHGSDSGIGGNYSFWKVWTRYFGKQKYPDGTVLRNSNGSLWKIQNGEKREYISKTAYLEHSRLEDAILVEDETIASYPAGAAIKFANYSLLKDTTTSKIYLIDRNVKRHITTPEALRKLGFNPEEIQNATTAELASYRDGFHIDESAINPTGELIKNTSTGEIFFSQNGFKYQLIDTTVLELNYPSRSARSASSTELNALYPGSPQKLKDGLLIRDSNGSVYITSKGLKLPIANEYTFNELFGAARMDAVTLVPQSVIALHSTGDAIELIENIPDPIAPEITTPTTPSQAATYKAVWNSTDAKKRLSPGEVATVSISYINNGTGIWKNNNVYIAATTEGGETTPLKHASWGKNNGGFIPQETSVGSKSIATFSFNVQAPATAGNYPLHIQLTRLDSVGNISIVPGGLVTIPISVVTNDYAASIVSHTLPVAVRNTWSTIPIEVEIKNTGTKAWTKKKVALIIENHQGKQSPFYDSADWLNASIAAVPIENTTTIQPGKTATFKFTLKTSGIPKGIQKLKMNIELKDVNKPVLLNAQNTFERYIRID
ncbi:MAG: hypothetical protein HOH01_00285 [Candidatus Jacksonbacteria bacterium]|nr:hypothetical protein [Candidatus Jacksonbacteria bacterium]